VSVLQFLLDLSGRDAAEAVRCRIDFEYALGLDLDLTAWNWSPKRCAALEELVRTRRELVKSFV
jgi:hypothetical protein